jgi:hypothetical protein
VTLILFLIICGGLLGGLIFAAVAETTSSAWSTWRILGTGGLCTLLVAGGYLAAHVVTASSASGSHPVRLVTTIRVPHKVRVHGRTVVRYRLRKKVVLAQARTVLETQTIHTAHGIKVVTRPVIRYRVTYRKHVITVAGKPVIVTTPVTNTQVLTNTLSQTETRTQTRTQTQTVSVPVTTTVISTETLPVTSTKTLTVTVTLPITIP